MTFVAAVILSISKEGLRAYYQSFQITIPHGETVLRKEGELFIISEPEDITTIEKWTTEGVLI